jgi:hypothetical protein
VGGLTAATSVNQTLPRSASLIEWRLGSPVVSPMMQPSTFARSASIRRASQPVSSSPTTQSRSVTGGSVSVSAIPLTSIPLTTIPTVLATPRDRTARSRRGQGVGEGVWTLEM